MFKYTDLWFNKIYHYLMILISKVKSNKKQIIPFKVLFINLFVLILLLLFFEPTIKSDDYDLQMVLYGAVNSEYSSIVMYCMVFFSSIISQLMKICPSVAWYMVCCYLLILTSLSIISFVYYKLQPRTVIYNVLILPFFAYELYIRFTFTKTSGVVIISGLLLLLFLIDEVKNSVLMAFFSFIWIAIGVSIRWSMLKLILVVFTSSFIISFIMSKSGKRKFTLIKFMVSVIVLLAMMKGLLFIDNEIKSKNKEWNAFFTEYNNARARLQDFYMPDYNEFENNYKEIGFSENDYLAFKNWALYIDYDYYTSEKLNSIADFNTQPSKNNTFDTIAKNLLSYYYSETGFYIFLLTLLMLWESYGLTKASKLIISTSIIVCSFITYAYMSYLGRLQHHVDVSVMMSAIVLIMYYYYKNNCYFSNTRVYCSLIIFISFCQVFYVSLSSASYYTLTVENQKEIYNDNKGIMDKLSADKEHIYVFCPNTTNGFYCSIFEPFEVIPKGYYSNLEMTNRYGIPTWDSIAENYGIDNYFKEATNSNVIYFVDLDLNKGWIDVIQTYINEHYCQSARYELVEEIGSVNVYRFVGE